MCKQCKYYDRENGGWCKLKSNWKDPMPEIVYCLGNCKDMVVEEEEGTRNESKMQSRFYTQLFRAATVEDLKHTADIWYKAANPTITRMTYTALENYVELYLIYEEKE